MSSYPDFRPSGVRPRVITWHGPEHDVALDVIEDETGGLTVLSVAVIAHEAPEDSPRRYSFPYDSKGILCVNALTYALQEPWPFRRDFAIPVALRTVEIRTGTTIYQVYPEILRRTSWARLLDD